MAEFLDAVAAAIAPGATVACSTMLHGGADSEVRLLELGATGSGRKVAVKTCDLVRHAADPDVFRRQAEVLAAVAAAGVPVPLPIMLDADGSRTGQPCLAMSFVAGTAAVPATELGARCQAMGRVLALIHAARPPSALPGWHPGRAPHFGSPGPGTVTEVPWTDLGAVTGAMSGWRPEAVGSPVVVHGDFHPGNLLWPDGQALPYVLDWDYVSAGPRGFDVAHCRADLVLMFGAPAADAMLSGYVSLAGPVDDLVRWDLHRSLAALRSFELWLPNMAPVGFELDLEPMRRRLELFIAGRADQLG